MSDLRTRRARATASDWARGPASALYRYAVTGKVDSEQDRQAVLLEVNQALRQAVQVPNSFEPIRLAALRKIVTEG